MAARSKAWVCRFLSGIAGSNPAEDMDVCLVRVVYQVEVSETGRSPVQRSLK